MKAFLNWKVYFKLYPDFDTGIAGFALKTFSIRDYVIRRDPESGRDPDQQPVLHIEQGVF